MAGFNAVVKLPEKPLTAPRTVPAIPRAALTVGPKNIFSNIVAPCVAHAQAKTPNKSQDANTTISLNNLRGKWMEYLHSLKLRLQ